MQNFAWLVLALLLSSCHAWTPSAQRLQEQCGHDFADAGAAYHVVQLTNPAGLPLTAAESEAVRVQFNGQNLPISAKGCVAVPRASGTLLAQNSLRSWALAESVEWEKETFHTLQFREPSTASVDLLCPEGGWLVNDRLDSVISFPAGFDPALVALQVQVKRPNTPTLELLQKDLGLGLDSRWQGFDLRALEEGSYQLQLNVRDLSKDWNPDVITSFRTCSLQIIRHIPELKAETVPQDHIFPLGQVLAPEFIDPTDRLFVCKEPGYQPSGCEAQSVCRGEDGFKEQALLRFDEKGAWTYHYFGKNRLGQSSRKSCLPALVSDEAPDLQVQWKKAAWNEPQAQEKSLPPDMEAVIDVKPGILSREELEKNLSCKVDFVFRGESVFPGNKVNCLSGRCRGRPMGDFVPCDASLRFGISEALQTDFLRDSEVRLSVKANDGAGHETTRTTSLWFSDSQHRTLDFSNFGPEDLGVSDTPGYFYFANDGGFLVQTAKWSSDHRYLYLPRFMDWGYSKVWKDGSLTEMPGKPTRTTAVQTSNGRIFAIFPTYEYINDVAKFRRFFAEFIGGKWVQKNIEGWNQDTETCEKLSVEFDGRLICQEFNRQVVIDPDRGTAVSSKFTEKDEDFRCGYGSQPILAAPQGYLYLFCRERLTMVRDRDGVWTSFKLARDYTPSLDSAVYDAMGRLWMRASEYQSTGVTDYLLRFDGSQIEEILLPADVEFFSIGGDKTFALDAEDRPRYADRRWNAGTRSWEVVPELREWLGQGALRVSPVKGTRGGLWYETMKFMLFINGNEKQLFPLKSLNWSSPDYPSEAGLGPNGQLCFMFRSESSSGDLRCQVDKVWSRVGRNYLNLPKDRIIYTDQTVNGEPLVITSHEGAYAWQGSGWKNVAPPAPKPYETFHVLYFYSDGVFYYRQNKEFYRFAPGDRDWVLVYTFPEYTGVNSGWEEFAFKDNVGNIWFTLMGGSVVRFDGKNWDFLSLPAGHIPNNVQAFEDKLLMLVSVNNDHQAFYWVDPKSYAMTPMDPKTEFGWDSELLNGPIPLSIAAIFDGGAILLTSQIDFKLKSVIFDLRSKKQTVIDSYQRLWNQRIVNFMRVDADHYLIAYPTMLGGNLGPNNDFRIIGSNGQNTLMFTSFEMKQMEENFDIAPRMNSWSVDGHPYLWMPAGTFGQDISDELFRIDLQPFLR